MESERKPKDAQSTPDTLTWEEQRKLLIQEHNSKLDLSQAGKSQAGFYKKHNKW